MSGDADLPLFSGRPIEPVERRPSTTTAPSPVAARRRAAKAARLRSPRRTMTPVRGDDGSVVSFACGIHRPTYADEWQAFMVEHPAALATIVRVAHEHAAASLGRLSIAKVWEDCRGKVGVELNNNHRAPAARYLMATHRALHGRFRTRDTAGDPERRL
jgi:hypothetical protein